MTAATRGHALHLSPFASSQDPRAVLQAASQLHVHTPHVRNLGALETLTTLAHMDALSSRG